MLAGVGLVDLGTRFSWMKMVLAPGRRIREMGEGPGLVGFQHCNQGLSDGV